MPFLLLHGFKPKQIADQFCRSKRTIEMHLENMRLKMHADSIPDMIFRMRLENYHDFFIADL